MAMTSSRNPEWALGIVVIGRNEGQRLVRCLESIARASRHARVVYVDSNSTDGSAEAARSLGAEVVELDASRPFTAAWARNTGWRRLLAIEPAVDLIHFLDGDCEVIDGWLEAAEQFMSTRPDVAVVCGRRRERAPGASIFNLLCEVEWNAPKGEVKSCGGDALFRRTVLERTGGYRDSLIAGEEPELCVRIRAQGGTVWRLDRDMVWHDAAMTRWSQWWRRSKRAGHAFAEGAWLHGDAPEHHYVAEQRRALVWGAALPLFIAVAGMINAWALLLAAVYPLQVVRLGLRPTASSVEAGATWPRAFFLVAGRFPEAAGALLFHWRRLRGRASTLIEYK